MKDWRLLVMIPSYNSGATLLARTVYSVLDCGIDTMVVIDGSTDGSEKILADDPKLKNRLCILHKPLNSGKGDAVRTGAIQALNSGYTHALIMDSDGQHPAGSISEFARASQARPEALIMGKPVFGQDAPWARVVGRKLTTFWTDLETLWTGLGDSLFGMRVYPLKPLIEAFSQTSFARGFDFDPEIAVRMTWMGHPSVQIPVKVTYLDKEAGGVSHFNYIRDNAKLTLLHFRLVPEFLLVRLLPFIFRIRQWKNAS